MEVRVLGPLEVWRDGSPVEVGRRRLRSILAQLVLARGRPVSVDRLVDSTWGGSPPSRAVATLHSYISNLRRIVEPERRPGEEPARLVTRAPGYALLLDDVTLDADLFASAAAAVRDALVAGDPGTAHRCADEALSLWRGPVLADLADEPFVRDYAVALDELRVAVAEDRVEAAAELGLASAIGDAEQLVAEHPARERPVRLLLTALYSAGRVSEALRRYDRFREQLVDDLGVDPSAELQQLHLAMLRGEALGSRSAVVARRPIRMPRDEHAADTADDGRVLVGREGEQAMIARFVAELPRGARWLVWHGEAGIGKTRLAEEAAAASRALGYTVAWGRCPEDADSPPYWAVTQVLRTLGHDAVAVLADRADPDLDAPTRRFLVNERAAGVLADSGRSAPVVAVLDDLQWADTATLDLLQLCATHLHDAPVGFVLTVRSGMRRPELDRLLATVARHAGTVAHEVPPLDVPHLQELCERLTGEPMTADTAAGFRARTGGNAFFATELLRLHPSGQAPTTALPLTVRQVLSRRLEVLPEATGAVLDVGAVAGPAFDLAVVAPAAGVSHGDALEALDPAVAAGLVVPADRAGAYAFAHALVRDAVLTAMPVARRTQIHARLADALLEVNGDADDAVSDRARHLVAAVPLVDPAQARRSARVAAEAAERQLAFVEAAEWWDDVAQLRPPPEELPGVLTAGARCLLLAGRTTAGRARVVAAATAARETGDAVAAAEALAQLRATGGAWPWVQPGEIPSGLLELMAAVVDELGHDAAVRAELLITYAIGLHYHPDRNRTLEVTDEAVALARQANDDRLLADVLLGACTSMWSADTVQQLLDTTAELLHLGRDAVPPSVEGAARLVRVNALWTLGDFEAADVELDRLRDRSAGFRSLWLSAQVSWAEVALDIARGYVDSARSRMPEAVRVHEMSGLYEALGQDTAGEFLIHALDGTLGELDDRYDAVLTQPEGRHEMPGLRAVAHGDVGKALAALRRSRLQPPYAYHWLATLALQAWLTTELASRDLHPGERDEVTGVAQALLGELAGHADRVAVLGTFLVLGPVSLWIARLQEVVEGPGAGAEAATAALRQAEATGMAPFARLARAVVAAGGGGADLSV